MPATPLLAALPHSTCALATKLYLCGISSPLSQIIQASLQDSLQSLFIPSKTQKSSLRHCQHHGYLSLRKSYCGNRRADIILRYCRVGRILQVHLKLFREPCLFSWTNSSDQEVPIALWVIGRTDDSDIVME